MAEDITLASEFPATTEAEWRKLVDAALKGASFEKRLVSQTYDGFRIEPLYPRAAGANTIAGRPAGTPWTVMQRVDLPDPAAANRQALEDLENGATGLTLVTAGSISANGYGLGGVEETLARALQGVRLDAIALELDLGPQHKDAGAYLASVIEEQDVAPERTQIRFGYDPLGAMAHAGGAPMPWPDIADLAYDLISDLSDRGFAGPFAAADGRYVHAAGGSEAQELAFVISNAVAYLRALVESGMMLERAREMIYFRLAADADEFLTIAKFRALRKLWARIEEASGLTPKPAFVSAETAWRMMTTRDPYVNMLRATIAVTAAGVGGADAITVLPFTQAIGLPDAFARRVARNLQLILLEESNLFRVADPAAGSGGIEALTTEIAHTAWTLFQEVEKAGGAPAALEQGLLQKKIAATRAARQAAVAKRKDAITGTSDYPNLGEQKVKVLAVPRVHVPPLPAAVAFEPLPSIRLSEPFEALRNKSDAILAKTGLRPKVFLANLGKLSDFTPRATFAKNFYEAGGIDVTGNDGFGDLPALVAAYKASGAKLACLCSSDKVYDIEAAAAAKMLKTAGAIVHLAGRPGQHEAEWRQGGVETFIYVGCNVLSTLQAAHDNLDIR